MFNLKLGKPLSLWNSILQSSTMAVCSRLLLHIPWLLLKPSNPTTSDLATLDWNKRIWRLWNGKPFKRRRWWFGPVIWVTSAERGNELLHNLSITVAGAERGHELPPSISLQTEWLLWREKERERARRRANDSDEGPQVVRSSEEYVAHVLERECFEWRIQHVAHARAIILFTIEAFTTSSLSLSSRLVDRLVSRFKWKMRSNRTLLPIQF